MGKYFINPFTLYYWSLFILLPAVVLALVVKILTLGASQVEIFIEDLAKYLNKRGFNSECE